MGRGKTRRQERRRHHVAQRHPGAGIALAATWRLSRHVADRVIAEDIGDPTEVLGIESEALQLAIERDRLFALILDHL